MYPLYSGGGAMHPLFSGGGAMCPLYSGGGAMHPLYSGGGACSNVGQCGGPIVCLGRAGRGASQPQPAIEQSGCDARVYIVCLHVCYSSCLPLAGDCPVRSRGCTMQLRAAACANSHLAILHWRRG